MEIRRRLIQIALAAMVVPAAWLAMAPAAQAQAFQRFTPLLIDLPGWQGDKPDGVAMEIPGSQHDLPPRASTSAVTRGSMRRS